MLWIREQRTVYLDAIAVLQLAGVRELVLPVLVALVRETQAGTGPLRQLARPGDEIRVDVRFGHLGDAQVLLCRRYQIFLFNISEMLRILKIIFIFDLRNLTY